MEKRTNRIKTTKKVSTIILAFIMLISPLGTTAFATQGVSVGSSMAYISGEEGVALRGMAFYGNYMYALATGGTTPGVKVYDISDIKAPIDITPNDSNLQGTPMDSYCGMIIVDSGYLYASFASPQEIRKYNLANPAAPAFVAKGASYKTTCMEIIGDGLFTANNYGVYQEFINDATSLTPWGQVGIAERESLAHTDIAVFLLSAKDTIIAYDYSPTGTGGILGLHYHDPYALCRIKNADYGRFRVNGNYLYCQDNGNKKIYRIDVTNYKNINTKSNYKVVYEGDSCDFDVDGDYLYVHVGAELKLIKMGDEPKEVAAISTNGQAVKDCVQLTKYGDRIYFCDNSGIGSFPLYYHEVEMTSGSSINLLPFTISGTFQNGDVIEATLNNGYMTTPYKKTVQAESDNTWSLVIDDIYNGEYTACVTLRDENGGFLADSTYVLSVNVSGGVNIEESNTTQNTTDNQSVRVGTLAINYDTNILNILGSIPMKTRIGFKEVGVSVIDPENVVIFNKKQKSLGNFDFLVNLGSSPYEIRDYTVTVSCEGEEDIVKTFKYYGPTFVAESLDAIKKSTESTIESVISTYNVVLSLDVGTGSTYYTLKNKKAVLNELAGKEFNTIIDVNNAFLAAVANQNDIESAIANIDSATNETEISTLLETYKTLLNINLDIAPYNDLSKEAKKSIYTDILNEENLTEEKLSEITSYDYCLLRLINTTVGVDLRKALVKYKSELGLSDSMVEKYTEKLDENALLTVEITITRINEEEYFTSLDEIANLFNETVGNTENASYPVKESDKGKGKNAGGVGGGISYKSVDKTTATNENTSASSEVFSDLNQASWAKESILYLYNKGIINGKTATIFAPNDNLNREEFIKMLVLATGASLTDEKCNFKDVKDDAWYYKYIATAVSTGVSNGIDENIFGVGQEITQEQMAVMLDRFIKYMKFELSEKNNVTFHGNISDYAKDSVNKLAKAGILNGTGEGIFDGNKTVTRAQAAKVIFELLKLYKER